MAEKTSVHGLTVIYEANAADGIRYLQSDLDYAEARVFFDQARQRGSAPFEDDADRQFTLIHEAPRAHARGVSAESAEAHSDVKPLERLPTAHSSADLRPRFSAKADKNGAYTLTRR